MKRHSIASLVLASILTLSIAGGSLTQIACGPKQLQTAAEAAKDIGGGTRDVIKAVGEAYHAGLLTLDQKDHLADLLSQIAKGGQRGVDAIDALNKAGFTTLPADKAQALNKLFSDEVVAPFLQLLTDVAKLTDAQSAAIRVSLASLRGIILLLSQKIGRTDVIDQINERWSAYAG